MVEIKDMELLQEYVARHSDEAFSILVQRHVNLVYSVALRQVGDVHKAQDITQAVFIILAQKAKGLRGETILSGWLYQTARLTAASFLRGELRRQRREQESFMQSTIEDQQAEPSWEQLAPVLEDAMGRLGDVERNAVLLRYFEGKSMLEVASDLGLNESAAKKRVSRAIEKLRSSFLRRGIAVSAGVLVTTIGTHSLQAAPAGFVASVTAAAVHGTAVTATASALVASTLKAFSAIKMKAAAALGAALMLASTTTALVVQETRTTGGVGLFLGRDQETGKFMVRRAYANSPAAKAGIPAGLILNKVNGIEIANGTVEEVPFQGRVGTRVTLEFIDPKTGRTNEVELVRDRF